MTTVETTEDTPRVYIASLSDYNNGDLLGRWFEFSDYTDADDLLSGIGDMLKVYDERFPLDFGQKREEWAAHDFSGFPRRFYSESMDFKAVYDYLEIVATMDEERAQAYELFVANGDEPSNFEDYYQGRYGEGYYYDEEKVLADYAETTWLECNSIKDIPASLCSYIDWQSLGRDYRLGGDVWQQDGHVFTTR